jgi:hypothetical protein
VSLHGLRELVRVSPVTPKELDTPLLGVTESLKGVTESVNGYHQSPTYRDLREYKEERVINSPSKFHLERFNNVILKPLPENLREFVKYGKNFDILLDQITLLGALKDVPVQLRSVNYDPGKNPGGLVLKVLNDLLTASKQRSERDRLDREHNQRVAKEMEDVARNASSDPSRHIEDARKRLGLIARD